MLRSLRFQLPALFLLGVVVAGLVSAAIALRLFRTYAQNRARAQAYAELSQEAAGLTHLYSREAGFKFLSARKLEQATGGDRIYYIGLQLFPGQRSAFRGLKGTLPKGIRARALARDRGVRFQFKPPEVKQTRLAVARRIRVG